MRKCNIMAFYTLCTRRYTMNQSQKSSIPIMKLTTNFNTSMTINMMFSLLTLKITLF